MDLRKETVPAGPVVTGFSGSGFRVGETLYPRGLILDPDAAREWNAPASADDLGLDMLGRLFALDPLPEFLLLGTGPRLIQPPRAFVAAVEAMGIGVEAMDSRAAARAWGVLRQEGRWIVAALMPLG
jgi:uncharacterized protein